MSNEASSKSNSRSPPLNMSFSTSELENLHQGVDFVRNSLLSLFLLHLGGGLIGAKLPPLITLKLGIFIA